MKISKLDELAQKINKEKTKRKRGRPKGTTKVAKTKEEFNKLSNKNMDNGHIDAEKIFLFVRKETIPKNQLDRFLKLCDMMIQSLGPEHISDTDIEEIALYYRDRIYIDSIYEEFAKDSITDTGLVSQIEKFNKSLEQRKVNLGSRFIDKGQKRKSTSGESVVDLVSRYEEEYAILQQEAEDKKYEILKNKKSKFSTLEDYMSFPSAGKSKTK